MEYTRMIQREIEDLLRQKIGLNPDSVGSRSILRAVKKGMRTGKMQGLSDYLVSLRTSPQLFEALVESIVVPETSFFRNRAAFVFLRQWISQEWQPQNRTAKRPLRVLSIPCSTGEEPYSIAITLLEEGMALEDFHIDAVDISARAIAKAKKGIYSPYAFRRQTYRSDDRYFALGVPEGAKGRRATQRYFLTETICQKISFIQGNLLDPDLLSNALPYDIVFCRNLLIYFDETARDYATQLLDRLLKPQGLLFVGYAETGLVDLNTYKSVPYPQTFAYRKQLDMASTAARLGSSAVDSGVLSPQNLAEDNAFQAVDKPLRAGQCGALQAARELADQGKVEQSAEQCDRYLLDYPADPQAHLLRGELYAAVGESTAAEACYKKAIYLNPQLPEALTHLMLIKAEQQDLAEVAVIRARLQRLAELSL